MLGLLLLQWYKKVEVGDEIQVSEFDTLHAAVLQLFDRLRPDVKADASRSSALHWVWQNPGRRKPSEGMEASLPKKLHMG
jgi:hypothetical protein